MKRNKCTYDIVINFPIFFWQECVACNYEYRREHGYHTMVGPFWQGIGKTIYVCKECAPDSLAADNAFKIYTSKQLNSTNLGNV